MNQKRRKRAIAGVALVVVFCLLATFGVYKWIEWKQVAAEPEPKEAIVEPVIKEVPKPAVKKPTEAPVVIAPEVPDSVLVTENEGEENLPPAIVEESAEGEGVQKEKKAPKEIYIPSTKSLFAESTATAEGMARRIMQSDYPAAGKVYFQGENGRIESFLSVNEAGAALEILVSYDAEGAEVDRLEIGVLTVDGEARKYATVLVNRLSVFELVASKTSGERQEQMTEYLITPNLSFRKGKTFRKLM